MHSPFSYTRCCCVVIARSLAHAKTVSSFTKELCFCLDFDSWRSRICSARGVYLARRTFDRGLTFNNVMKKTNVFSKTCLSSPITRTEINKNYENWFEFSFRSRLYPEFVLFICFFFRFYSTLFYAYLFLFLRFHKAVYNYVNGRRIKSKESRCRTRGKLH